MRPHSTRDFVFLWKIHKIFTPLCRGRSNQWERFSEKRKTFSLNLFWKRPGSTGNIISLPPPKKPIMHPRIQSFSGKISSILGKIGGWIKSFPHCPQSFPQNGAFPAISILVNIKLGAWFLSFSRFFCHWHFDNASPTRPKNSSWQRNWQLTEENIHKFLQALLRGMPQEPATPTLAGSTYCVCRSSRTQLTAVCKKAGKIIVFFSKRYWFYGKPSL